MIKIENVSKNFGEKIALQNVILNLEAGKTHVIIGSSGCGKSTLLKCIMGLIPVSSGNITIGKKQVTLDSRNEIAKTLGYVVQDAGLFPHLTAEANISLVMRTLNTPKETIQKRINELTDLVRLDSGFLKSFPKELSGGQKQRVGLVRALMLDPDLLLLDEPLGALDPIVRSHLQFEIKRICDSVKKTVIVVTHDLGEAAFFGHTITLMNEGKVVQHGSLKDLVHSPATPFVTEFLKAQRPPKELSDV